MKNVNKNIFNADCMEILPKIKDGRVKLTLTDIPYGEVNRSTNGLRDLDKKKADEMTFDLEKFLEQVYRITSSTIIIFCGKGQMSEIYNWFDAKQKQGKGTVRQLIYKKRNPSPMNGQYIYLSDTENAVWFKKRGGTFNARCKGTVFDYPCGRNKIHPTEKHHGLLEELILDNSNEGDMVFDPCAGSLSSLYVAKKLGRKIAGCELNKEYYELGLERIEELIA